MPEPDAPARPPSRALLLALAGNLVAVSAIVLPLLPASTHSFGSFMAPSGTWFTPLSGWQILTFPAPQGERVVTLLQGSSYVALAPVAFALLALLALPSVLISRYAPSWLTFYRALAICGLLSLLLATTLALLAAQTPPIHALALGIVLAGLYAAFLAMITGGTLALR